MTSYREMLSFATLLYRQRAGIAYAGYLRREPMALLLLRPGRDNPYAVYDRMRRDGTLTLSPLGHWVSTSHRVCLSVLRDRRFGVRPADGPIADPASDQFDMSFLARNPPDHTRLRRLVQPAFGPRRIAAYRPRIEAVVSALLDRAGAAGSFDLVGALASPLPIAVITDLLGVPDADAETFARHGTVIGRAIDGIQSLGHARQLRQADAELSVLFESLFALRRRVPADDVISALVAAGDDQVRPAELLPLCVLLLIAGFETTVNLIGNAVNTLLDHPEQWAALCADPAGLAAQVVEETLRFDPPVQRTVRFAMEPVELVGQAVGRNDAVVTLIGAANRDPEAFTDPDRFDIHREQTVDHLAFSGGIHYCIGQPLARLEATVALELLAERMPTLRRAGRVRRRTSNTIRGPIRLPVRR